MPIIIFQILFVIRTGTLVNMSFLCACEVPEKTDKTSNLTWSTSMTYCATADVLRMIRERQGDLVWVNKRVTAECLRSISRENESHVAKTTELLREFINLVSSIYLHVRVVWVNIKTESSSKSWNESIALLSTRIFGLFGYINPLQLHQVYTVKKKITQKSRKV